MRRSLEKTIRDDRGAVVPKTRWTYNGQYPMPWHDVFQRTPTAWRRFQVLSYFVVAPYAAAILVTLLVPSGSVRQFGHAISDVFPYAMLPLIVVYAYLHFTQFRPWLKQYRSAQGRCQACDYDLTGLTPDPDGCTTCPECGAAWRLPPEPPTT
ncbi:MAG: hypothetical protein RIB58_05790 [Phycisphaerales bacterium]